jgi:hypothetical protein
MSSGVSAAPTLRNVTAYAPTGEAMQIDGASGAQISFDVKNSILLGSGPNDISVSQTGGANVNIALAHSNYDTVNASGGATVTDPNTANNQTADPDFVSAPSFDFHQAPISPTVDAGDGSASSLGTLDLDRENRITDGDCDGTSAPDIGADELADTDGDVDADACDTCPADANPGQQDTDNDGDGDACDNDLDGDGIANAGDNCPSASNPDQADNDADGAGNVCDATPDPPSGGGGPDTTPPDTTITEGPSGKSKKKTATFSFSGTDARAVASFHCRLDDGPFEACASPKAYSKLKKGRHTFEVRSVDAAGNADPTPATRTWKIKRKKKRA